MAVTTPGNRKAVTRECIVAFYTTIGDLPYAHGRGFIKNLAFDVLLGVECDLSTKANAGYSQQSE